MFVVVVLNTTHIMHNQLDTFFTISISSPSMWKGLWEISSRLQQLLFINCALTVNKI